ncbi:MAG: adenylate/guanylate cyclase domain-containing protein [bacterium]
MPGDGLHSGPVMAGIVGRSKFTFDVWGDAVNTAARMEGASDSDRIAVSENTYRAVSRFFDFEPRGEVEIKGKNPIGSYFLQKIKAEFSEDGDGKRPNEAFRTAAGF